MIGKEHWAFPVWLKRVYRDGHEYRQLMPRLLAECTMALIPGAMKDAQASGQLTPDTEIVRAIIEASAPVEVDPHKEWHPAKKPEVKWDLVLKMAEAKPGEKKDAGASPDIAALLGGF